VKVLWVTNTFLPETPGDAFDLLGGGGWMSTLMTALKERTDLGLAVGSARPAVRLEAYTTNGVQCFVVPCGQRENARDQRNAVPCCGR